jgi:hypothetical protein
MSPVRELVAGDRPRDWIESANDAPADTQQAREAVGETAGDSAVSAPARVVTTSDEELAPERYKVQFTATEEYVRLVEEAKALLSHAAPRASIEEVHPARHAGARDGAQKEKVRRRGRARASRSGVGSECRARAGRRRCAERHLLEFHHLKAFALGGPHTAENGLSRARIRSAGTSR